MTINFYKITELSIYASIILSVIFSILSVFDIGAFSSNYAIGYSLLPFTVVFGSVLVGLLFKFVFDIAINSIKALYIGLKSKKALKIEYKNL